MNVINARLLAAAMHGDEVELKAILRESGGGALTKTLGMQNALAWAAREGHEDCVRLLLPVSDSWGKDGYGMTPLMHAASAGHDACVELLLAVSDALAQNKDGMTALMWAAGSGQEACVRLLLPESDVLATNVGGKTASMFAHERCHKSLAKFLEAYELSQVEQASVEESACAGASCKSVAPRL